MRAIGGYFELEVKRGQHYHDNAIRLNTARNCFEFVLRVRNCRKVYVPYYTCEVMLEPIQKLGLDYEFYHINERLEPAVLPDLGPDEAFLYTNYFGLKQNCVKRLSSFYGQQLIVDNAQAFFDMPIEGIDTFYSARKFFGVADGAYLYTDKPIPWVLERDCSSQRMSHLLKRFDLGAEEGYPDFRRNDDDLIGQDIKTISNLTDALLSGIDYNGIRRKRRDNYHCLDRELIESNRMQFELDNNAVPMVYPYLTDGFSLKKKLIDNRIYVATYWPNVYKWCQHGDWEYELADRMVFLPIDQRYDQNDMDRIIETIHS